MARSYKYLASDLRGFIGDLQRSRYQTVVGLATSLGTIIIDRVQQQGKKADGSSFGKYSEAVVPYWFFKGKGTKSNAHKIGLKRHGYFFSYKDFREINGRQTKFKDFTFTGEMFRDIETNIQVKNGDIIYCSIYPKREFNQKKLDWNSAKFGKILQASDLELANTQDDYVFHIVDLLIKNNLVR